MVLYKALTSQPLHVDENQSEQQESKNRAPTEQDQKTMPENISSIMTTDACLALTAKAQKTKDKTICLLQWPTTVLQ